ncbi:hypothetical protein [Cryptosporidium parvum Iowa II]|uniref:Uncharacterized protein n=2 Tax=Cryptosporidium parvum TaxID=5807 RepID=Q5CQW6_CRYPI|nr:hypothetical protein [Cryptosporidium parvum Iowa II]EAK87810.1 hypothetical protein with a signal peptide [Cryptosporidium parvum Iowa II]QOY42137.1 Alpha/Beta hydrolase fold containing protein [Cryptosporidium parvum]WKS77439.1 putative signal peptide-containing protein [Cryptosporidium sp. 43IA8]WRK31889.1 Alpha/Beta hydrolase fold containing protein [Cryptosporidium parvum]|eukprot:QOY42137.1 hypothetical protein CPATCC_001744 [Cryptosporidium parvum]
MLVRLAKLVIVIVFISQFTPNSCLTQNPFQPGYREVVPVEEKNSRTFLLRERADSSDIPLPNHFPNEPFYSTSDYTLDIKVKLAFYGDYINSDFENIKVKAKHGPRIINTCGHFVHKSLPPKYTIIVSLGGLSTHACSEESLKFFRKYINYISSIYGLEIVNSTQFIFLNWFYLVYHGSNDLYFSKKMVRYWISKPKKKDIIIPAVSSAAFINKLFRIGVIPSLSDTGAYGLCIGTLNIALASLLIKENMKVVVLNAPSFFWKNYLEDVLDDSLIGKKTTKYFILSGKSDRIFHYKRHGRKLSNFLSNYSDYVRYFKLDADHAELIITYIYTSMRMIATVLLDKKCSITYIKTKDYNKIPKSFSQSHWFRYVMYQLKESEHLEK